jgi:hypothetical protein
MGLTFLRGILPLCENGFWTLHDEQVKSRSSTDAARFALMTAGHREILRPVAHFPYAVHWT